MKATLNTTDFVSAANSKRSSFSDEELLLRYRHTGNREYFNALVRRFERELYNYLRRFLGDPELAEDTFQATFLQLHLKCEKFEEGRKVRPWLYTIATNQAIDAQRRNRRHQAFSLDRVPDHGGGTGFETASRMVSDEPNPLTLAGDGERNQLLQDALAQLPEEMQSVVNLVYYQGLKYREAADVLSIPVGTVKSRIHAAIAKLTRFWHKHHADLD